MRSHYLTAFLHISSGSAATTKLASADISLTGCCLLEKKEAKKQKSWLGCALRLNGNPVTVVRELHHSRHLSAAKLHHSQRSASERNLRGKVQRVSDTSAGTTCRHFDCLSCCLTRAFFTQLHRSLSFATHTHTRRELARQRCLRV